MECPIEPDQSECCNSGCNPCIFDVYEQQLQKYKKYQFSPLLSIKNCLKELKYTKFRLVDILEESLHGNIYIFQCNLHFYDSTDDAKECNVFCAPGQHLLLRGKSKTDSNEFSRAYTPIPLDGLQKTQFAVLIKLYKIGDMSNLIKRLKIGDITEWRGPYGDYEINFKLNYVVMIAQGTGIAPIYAVIKQMLDNDECDTRMQLVYCCHDLGDVHLRKSLLNLQDYWNFKYEVFLSVECPENDVKYNEVVHCEKLQEKHIENFLKDIIDDVTGSQVLICGSDMFAESIKTSIRKFSSVLVHCF